MEVSLPAKAGSFALVPRNRPTPKAVDVEEIIRLVHYGGCRQGGGLSLDSRIIASVKKSLQRVVVMNHNPGDAVTLRGTGALLPCGGCVMVGGVRTCCRKMGVFFGFEDLSLPTVFLSERLRLLIRVE